MKDDVTKFIFYHYQKKILEFDDILLEDEKSQKIKKWYLEDLDYSN